MPSGREKYFKNYNVERIKKPSGKGYKTVYTYIGDMYSWDISKKDLQKERLFFAFCEVISGIFFFAAAVRRIALNSIGFIAVPAILSLGVWVFELFSVVFFAFVKLPMREDYFNRIDNTFYFTFILRFLLLVFAAVCGVIFTIWYSCGVEGWFVSICYAICAGFAFAMRNRYKKLKKAQKVIPSQQD